MSIIQKIRDKAAWLVFGLIALSLIGFILMDRFRGPGNSGATTGDVGSVNGEKLDYVDFQKQVSANEDRAKAQGLPLDGNPMMQQNIRDQVWKNFEDETLVKSECDKLGINVTDKELNDMLVGQNAVQEIKQGFTDPNTGEFNPQAAAARINQLRAVYVGNKKTDKDYPVAQNFFEIGLPQFVKMREREKYISLLANSTYYPKWMLEKTAADNSQVASIDMVNIPYTSISDSAVKVSDAEVGDYLEKHAEQYPQEDTRGIRYISFSAAPTTADSNGVRQAVAGLKSEFTSTKDVEGFLARNGTEINYTGAFTAKSKLTGVAKDSLAKMQVGEVIGPYLDGANYVLARVIAIENRPDSVKARHILVATVDLRTQQPKLDDSTAHKRIDSIKSLVDHGQNFDSVATKLSDDEGSRVKGGDLGYFTDGQMVKDFNEFAFTGKKGERKIVKTQFGYHFIEIEDQKGLEPSYKIAYFARKIEPSTETDDNASGLASQFAGNNRSQAAFDENSKKQENVTRSTAQDIKAVDFSVQGLGASRPLVRWIFDAKLGEVSEAFSVGDKYVVAMLTDINQKGTMTVAKSRPIIEPILRNQKKAQQIMQKVGAPATLEAVSASSSIPVTKTDSLAFTSPYIPNVGPEPKIVGYAFDKQLNGKPVSSGVGGNEGVFYLKVNQISARANYGGDVETMRKTMQAQQESVMQRAALESLRKQAKITDNRAKFL